MAVLNLCKKIFGVTFHAYMSPDDLVNAWQRVPVHIRAQWPALDQLMMNAYYAFAVVKTQRVITEALYYAKMAQEQGTLFAAATLGGNFAYGPAVAALNSAKVVLTQFQDDLFQNLQQVLNDVNLGCNG